MGFYDEYHYRQMKRMMLNTCRHNNVSFHKLEKSISCKCKDCEGSFLIFDKNSPSALRRIRDAVNTIVVAIDTMKIYGKDNPEFNTCINKYISILPLLTELPDAFTAVTKNSTIDIDIEEKSSIDNEKAPNNNEVDLLKQWRESVYENNEQDYLDDEEDTDTETEDNLAAENETEEYEKKIKFSDDAKPDENSTISKEGDKLLKVLIKNQICSNSSNANIGIVDIDYFLNMTTKEFDNLKENNKLLNSIAWIKNPLKEYGSGLWRVIGVNHDNTLYTIDLMAITPIAVCKYGEDGYTADRYLKNFMNGLDSKVLSRAMNMKIAPFGYVEWTNIKLPSTTELGFESAIINDGHIYDVFPRITTTPFSLHNSLKLSNNGFWIRAVHSMMVNKVGSLINVDWFVDIEASLLPIIRLRIKNEE